MKLKKSFVLMNEALTKKRSKKKNKGVQRFECKEEYFVKNGAILLEKKIALSQGKEIGSGLLKILSEDEICKATNNYDPDLIIGSFRGGSLYKGTFDGRLVAIKTSRQGEANPHLGELFLTEVTMRMVMCHENMIKVYGCCLETYIPITVHQFLPSCKNLHKYLHGGMAFEKPMKWSDRMRTVSDVGYALSYMHSAFPKPIIHRDIMSFCILIDTPFCAKLTNLGHSVSITPGKKDQRFPVHDIPGYTDPEYNETQEVTDKCDVYSFGVLMLELLTMRDPIEMAKSGNDLVNEFVSSVKTNGGNEMIDKHVLEEGIMKEIQSFVRLALMCVAKRGKERPTMTEVVDELWMMQDQGTSN